MIYRLGKRSRRRFNGVRLLSLLALVGTALPIAVVLLVVRGEDTAVFARKLIHRQPSRQSALSRKSAAGTAHSNHKPARTTTASATVTTPVVTAAVAVGEAGCGGSGAVHAGMSGSANAELRKLAQYEQACGTAVAQRDSFFTGTPTTKGEATSMATDVAQRLKEYAAYGVQPLVFMEPTSAGGGNLDLQAYRNGAYDAALDAYFAALQAKGITSAMMGLWIHLPEGNIPVWSGVDPNTFAAVVTKVSQLQKKYFPQSQTGIMLDSQSYPAGATWGGGAYVSWKPFIQNIPQGLIDSVGLQGFPWASPANGPDDSVYDSTAYLRTDLLTEAAHMLGTANVWFNTGTFGRAYTLTPAQLVTVSDAARRQMLQSVIAQAKALQTQGFTVSVHVFAEDKSRTDEAIDWSYWHTQPGDGTATAIFTDFARNAQASGVPLWIFDSTE